MVITILFLRICFVSILLISSHFFSSSPVLAKSRHPISDAEIRQKKLQCYADIDSGMWGWPCKSSMIARENCALRCLSPACYELIYESDPLEEGEKDLIRSQEYKYCMHKILHVCWEWIFGDIILYLVGHAFLSIALSWKLGQTNSHKNSDFIWQFKGCPWERALRVLRVPLATNQCKNSESKAKAMANLYRKMTSYATSCSFAFSPSSNPSPYDMP